MIESISDNLDNSATRKIKSTVYADKGYDSRTIGDYLRSRHIKDCISKKKIRTRQEEDILE